MTPLVATPQLAREAFFAEDLPDDEREAFVYAEFDSDEAFARYRKGLVVQQIGERLTPLLDARPSFKHFSANVLEPG